MSEKLQTPVYMSNQAEGLKVSLNGPNSVSTRPELTSPIVSLPTAEVPQNLAVTTELGQETDIAKETAGYGDERDRPGRIGIYRWREQTSTVVNGETKWQTVEKQRRVKILGNTKKYPGGVAEAYGVHYVEVVDMDTGSVNPAVPSRSINFEDTSQEQSIDKSATQTTEASSPEEPPAKTNLPESQDSPDYKALEFDVKPLESESTSLPEMPDFSRPEERDWRRINREAKDYFEDFDGPESIVSLRQGLAEHEKAVKDAMLKQLQELGITDINNERVIEDLVIKKVAEALETARAKKITELTAKTVPYGEDTRKARNQVSQKRESLARMLNMPAEQFDQLLKDWQHYDIDQAHGQALEDDKGYKVGEQRKAAKGKIEALDEKYGGVLGEISQLPLNRETGGVTDTAINEHLKRQHQIDAMQGDLASKDLLKEVSLAQGVRDFTEQLKQKYQAQGLSPEEIKAKIDADSALLETWLQHIDGNFALLELKKYENQGNKKEMLDGRRQKAGEYIGSTLLMRALRGELRREKSPETQPDIEVGEILERGIDHSGSRSKAGAEVLANPNRAGSFLGRIMSQLEMARTLSRNESTLMKSLIYMTALEKSLGDGFISAWEAIPEEKKRAARKKIMLGMAATSAALVRMSAKTAAKARKAGATGAAAGTIWMGNQLRR